MENLKRVGGAGRLLVAAAALFLAAHGAQAQAGGSPVVRTLTLEDVFRQVRGENPGIQAGEAGVEAARAETRQALAALLPAIRAEAQQTRQRYPLAGSAFGGAVGEGENDNGDNGEESPDALHFNSFTAGVSLRVPVVEARTIANWKAAQLQQKATELQQVTNIQDTYAQAAELYFTHLRNLSRLEVIRSNIERDQLLLDIARQRRQAGVATELDVTRGEAALARDRRDMLAQQTLVTQTRLALLRVMNLEPTTRLELTPEPVDAPRASGLPGSESVVESRPEYEAAQAILRRNIVAERAASWQRFPNIDLIGEYGVQSPMAFDGDEEEAWLVGVSLSVPIWEGGRIRAERRQARAAIRQQEYVIQEIDNQISADYILAVEAVQQRWEELPFARDSVRLSEQELQFARERFEAGVADNSDVVTAQAGLAQANDAEVDAVFRYHLARITLARVLGRVAEELTQR